MPKPGKKLTKDEQILRNWYESPARMVRELFGATPDRWQQEALDAFRSSPRMAMAACAGPGKSTVLAWLGWNFLLTRPHPWIGVTSITGDNLKSGLWTELARWYQKSEFLRQQFEFQKEQIFLKEHPATWKMEARKWAKDADDQSIGNALRGPHSRYIMWLLDESGDMPNSIMPVCENIFAGNPKEAHIVQAGNPTRIDGPLYRACHTAADLWRVIRITADPDDPMRTPRVSIEHARQQIQQYGRDNPWVMINILGQFPPSNLNSLIGHDEVRASMNRMYREYELTGSPRVMGIDVAREGDDQSVIAKRRGLQMFPLIKHRNLDGNQGASITAREWQEFMADACFIDATGGFGASWIDNLTRLGRQPIGVQFSSSAIQDARYANKRAEMAMELVDWIRRGGALPHDERLLAALTQTTYTFRGDRLLIQPKEQVKAALGYSPDEMDACMLTVAAPVQPAVRRTGARPASAVSGNYDPFGGMETPVPGGFW